MKKFFFLMLLVTLTVFSCQKKLVCPAYQSAFYLDKEKTEDFFSLFGEDSLPKSDFFVNKNKYGIIVKVKYKKRQQAMKTVKMKTIFPPPTDSLLLANNNIAEMDSASVDTLFTQGYKDRFKFNRDQKLYMLAMDPFFDYEDPEEESVESNDEASSATSEEEGPEEKKKKSWWPFGKKNRNKDKNADQDEEEIEEEAADEEENGQ